MATLRYVGRPSDDLFGVLSKKWVDDRYVQTKVDIAYVNAISAEAAALLATPSYVTTQDGQRASKAAVDAADNGYLLKSQRGLPNGVASIGADGFIPASQVPSPETQRKPIFRDASVAGVGTVYLASDRSITSTADPNPNDAGQFKAATLTIQDPGFPYIPLTFASIQGGATQGSQGIRVYGTGTYGLATAWGSDGKRYAQAVCTDTKTLSHHLVLPLARIDDVPYQVKGNLTLELWLSLLEMGAGATAYVFTPTDFMFYTLVYPAF